MSDDREFRIHVVPPKFTQLTSYKFYQDQNFMNITAAEGETNAARASVRLTLARSAKDGSYFNVWSRLSSTTIIPTSARVLTANHLPAVIVEGRFMDADAGRIPFSIYDLYGTCITNGTFAAQRENAADKNAKTNWTFDGKNVGLFGRDGKLLLTIKINTY